MNNMKRIIINQSKWICGAPGNVYHEPNEKNQLGEGHTALLNDRGFMCCLGQAALQINRSLQERDIGRLGLPSDLDVVIRALSKRVNGKIVNTKLSLQAIDINDDPDTSVAEKKRRLRKLFAKSGYKLVFSKK